MTRVEIEIIRIVIGRIDNDDLPEDWQENLCNLALRALELEVKMKEADEIIQTVSCYNLDPRADKSVDEYLVKHGIPNFAEAYKARALGKKEGE